MNNLQLWLLAVLSLIIAMSFKDEFNPEGMTLIFIIQNLKCNNNYFSDQSWPVPCEFEGC